MTSPTTFFLTTYIIMIATWTKIIKGGEVITCTDPSGCNWVCSGNIKCTNNVYHCPSTVSYCDLTCNSCNMVQIFSSSNTFDIDCMDGNGCSNMQITAQTSTSNINLYCGSRSRCVDITLQCPSDSLQNCKCTDNLQDICVQQVSITPIDQETTEYPTSIPSKYPTILSSKNPTQSPSKKPTQFSFKNPTESPLKNPTQSPSKYPTRSPSKYPTQASASIANTRIFPSIITTHYPTAATVYTSTLDVLSEAEVHELNGTNSFLLVLKSPLRNNGTVNISVIVIATAIIFTLSAGVGFVYIVYKKAERTSSINVFGFDESELDHRSHAVVRKKQTGSTSSYVMTMVDRVGTNMTLSEPTRTKKVADAMLVLGNLHTSGALWTNSDGIMVREESHSNDTHLDSLYGPGTGNKTLTGISGLDTVELGYNDPEIDAIITDSD